jgi:hypothetical protein
MKQFSPDFPTRRSVKPFAGGAVESYLLRLDPANKQIISSTFWGGSKRDAGAALALGPGENVTLAGESYSENLPLQNALRQQFGPTTDAFVARFCDPWLSTHPTESLLFSPISGAETLDVLTGCTAADDFEISVDQPWLHVRYQGRTAPMKLTVEADARDLAPGKYNAEIRVKLPAAFYPDLTISITLIVPELPPAQ